MPFQRLATALLAATMAPLALASCASVPPASVAAPGPALRAGEHEADLNGARVWYRVGGSWDGRAAPVVFLAGGPGGNSYVFAKIAGPSLEADNLMVYYDQRGTGRSERPSSGDYAITTLVDDIEALRLHLGVPKLSLIAHSFGAILALEYAAKYPRRVEAAVLAGPLWNAPLSCREHIERLAELRPDVHRTLMALGEPPETETCERSFRAVPGREGERITEANMYPNAATLERVSRAEAESGLRNTGELGRAVFRAGLLRYRFAGAERVSAPVLVVGGSRDFAAGPRAQRRLAEILPRGRFAEYEGLGHWMFVEDPERFARDVSRFLDEAAQSR